MSTNCVRCIANARTGTDLMCDACRAKARPNKNDQTRHDCVSLEEMERLVQKFPQTPAVLETLYQHAEDEDFVISSQQAFALFEPVKPEVQAEMFAGATNAR